MNWTKPDGDKGCEGVEGLLQHANSCWSTQLTLLQEGFAAFWLQSINTFPA